MAQASVTIHAQMNVLTNYWSKVALAWVLSNKTVSAPIIGSTKIESLIELAQATHIVLTADEIAAISHDYRPRPIVGHS